MDPARHSRWYQYNTLGVHVGTHVGVHVSSHVGVHVKSQHIGPGLSARMCCSGV